MHHVPLLFNTFFILFLFFSLFFSFYFCKRKQLVLPASSTMDLIKNLQYRYRQFPPCTNLNREFRFTFANFYFYHVKLFFSPSTHARTGTQSELVFTDINPEILSFTLVWFHHCNSTHHIYLSQILSRSNKLINNYSEFFKANKASRALIIRINGRYSCGSTIRLYERREQIGWKKISLRTSTRRQGIDLQRSIAIRKYWRLYWRARKFSGLN